MMRLGPGAVRLQMTINWHQMSVEKGFGDLMCHALMVFEHLN